MIVAAALEAPAIVAGLDDVAVMGEAVEQRGRTERQRDLSVMYGKVGDVLVAQGKLDEALKAYRDGLAIRERLAAADRSNNRWQRAAKARGKGKNRPPNQHY
jgi:hypothetical protein